MHPDRTYNAALRLAADTILTLSHNPPTTEFDDWTYGSDPAPTQFLEQALAARGARTTQQVIDDLDALLDRLRADRRAAGLPPTGRPVSNRPNDEPLRYVTITELVDDNDHEGRAPGADKYTAAIIPPITENT